MIKEQWTIDNIPNLTNRVIIVTGGNSGIGFEAAKEFSRKDAEIILACRNLNKAKAANARILEDIPNAKIEIIELDLASQKSVRHFTEQFKKKYKQLDILVNNAGIMSIPYSVTEDGFESQFATNHLGHFALTGLLIDLLIKTAGSRVVNISSNAHKMGRMDFDNLMFEDGKGYSPMSSYGRSKLANLLFTYELHRRFNATKVKSIAVSAHPGISHTNLGLHLENKIIFKIINKIIGGMTQSAQMGAMPTIRAATDRNVCSGEYYGPSGFMEMKGFPVIVSSNKASHNIEDAQRLWKISEDLTGVKYL